jgi:hypothetical protein
MDVDFDELAARLGLETSILAERGSEGLAIGASMDGSSQICSNCGGLVSGKRMEAHRLYWCHSLSD